MADLLIRNIEPSLKRRIEERARAHHRSLSDEAKTLLHKGLIQAQSDDQLGTLLFNLVRPEDRGDDLVFEAPRHISSPPDIE